MKEKKSFGPKQVGERIRERRTELKLSMPELGKRLGVNKSTIQRYEADGVDPKRTMIIDGLAHALLTTPEWLTGLSEDKEYTSYTVCQMDLEKHVKDYLETLTASVKGEPHQQLLTTLIKLKTIMVIDDIYTTGATIDAVAEDEGLKESIGRYAINIGSITEQVYRKEMAEPIEDMKQYLDGILHLYDEGRTKTRLQEQFGMVEEAQRKYREAAAEIAGHEGT